MPPDETFPKGAFTATEQSVHGDNNTVVGRDYVVSPPVEFRSTPSDILKVLQHLDAIIDTEGFRAEREYGSPSAIDAKIEHNHIDRYEEFIREYGQYGHAVLGALKVLEENQPTIGPRVKRFIRSIYRDVAAKKKDQCADDILELVVERLRKLTGQVPEVSLAVINPTCSMLVAHAFINCDILKRVPVLVVHANS